MDLRVYTKLLEAMGITALSKPDCVPISVSDSLCRLLAPLLTRRQLVHLPLAATPLAPQVGDALAGGCRGSGGVGYVKRVEWSAKGVFARSVARVT